jgi:hypothetical protein
MRIEYFAVIDARLKQFLRRHVITDLGIIETCQALPTTIMRASIHKDAEGINHFSGAGAQTAIKVVENELNCRLSKRLQDDKKVVTPNIHIMCTRTPSGDNTTTTFHMFVYRMHHKEVDFWIGDGGLPSYTPIIGHDTGVVYQ